MHGQLIDGSGLAQFLDLAKLSITGAGNIAVNVPHITSARYVLEVCACAEYKAMKVLYDSFDSGGSISDWI